MADCKLREFDGDTGNNFIIKLHELQGKWFEFLSFFTASFREPSFK